MPAALTAMRLYLDEIPHTEVASTYVSGKKNTK